MLSAVAPRWPRAFSSIGIGASAILMTFFTLASAIIEKEEKYDARIGALDILTSSLESASGNIVVALTIGGFFIAYVVGELIIIGSCWRYYSGPKGARLYRRRIKFALFENDALYENFDRRESSIELLLGVFALVILAAVSRLMYILDTSSYGFRPFGEVVVLIGFSLVPYFAAQRLDWQSDQELQELDVLMDRQP